MNKTTNILFSFLKWLITILAVGNLIFLFVFDYQIPGFLRLPFLSAGSAVEETEGSETETTDSALIRINVPSQALSYDGSGKLDLMDGISVTDANGTEQSDIKIFSSIKAGSSRREKIIEYSATDANGTRVTAERTLTLAGSYAGPSIEILGDMPSVMEDELPSLASRLASDGLMKADDGFGKDVTSSVISSVKSEADDSGSCTVTLSIVNLVNDTYSLDVNISTHISGPVLRLTKDKVTLNVGETFNFFDYIAAAQDEEGNSLFESISMRGSVDTSTPGEYTLEFYCTDSSGTTSPVKKLTVTVKE